VRGAGHLIGAKLTTAGRWFVSGSEPPEPVASAINAADSAFGLCWG